MVIGVTTVANASTVTLRGLAASLVYIEGDVLPGLPRFTIVGLPDAALAESKNRVRSALVNSGLPFPREALTINLSPASLPKHGSGFDLAIAVVLLQIQQIIALHASQPTAFIGELGLNGTIRSTPGVLATVRGARTLGFDRIYVPLADAQEAQLVPGIDVVGVGHLRNLVVLLGGEGSYDDSLDELSAATTTLQTSDGERAVEDDLADVVGQTLAVEALIVAAAGGHHMLMIGPQGSGKTMLAKRLSSILPDLNESHALTVSALESLRGVRAHHSLSTRPPLQAPHHTATTAAIVGGGSRPIHPGAVSLASHGVLFLDEAAEFKRTVLDALRQCLESREITIHRANDMAVFPAAFQLVMAANPCPCGMDGVIGAICECTPTARRQYLAKLSGPLIDRMDVSMRVPKSQPQLGERGAISTQEARERVAAARAAQSERLSTFGIGLNVEVSTNILHGPLRMSVSALAPIRRLLERGALSMRGADKILRLAWSIADLAGKTSPDRECLEQAMYYRGAST